MKNKKLLTILGVTTLLVGGMFVNQGTRPVDAANLAANTYVYFEKPSTWNASYVQLLIGHGGWSEGYSMTNIANTDIYYVKMIAWGGYEQYGFMNTNEAKWGGEGSAPKDRIQWAVNKTNICYASGLALDKTYNLFGGSATDPWAYPTKGTAVSNMNFTVTANATTGGTATVKGYELTSATAVTSKSGTSVNALKFTDVTLTATANADYKFVGWYDESDKLVSSNETYNIKDVTAAATYSAKFESVLPGEVEDLVSKYYGEGTYTRDTTINFNEEAVNEISEYFHAKATQLVRTTHFTPDALWMSRGNGEYSYYGSEGGNLTNGTATEVNVVPSYHTAVKNTSMEDYYTTLKDIKNAVASATWTKSGSVYSSTDATLIQYFLDFTAPCFLNHNDSNANYLGLEKVTVEESGESLLLKLHVKSGDSGKLVGENNTVLSVATITK